MEFQFIHRDAYPEADGDFPNQTVNTKSVVFSDGTVWTKVLDQFLDFLSSVYGYEVKESVKYETFTEKMARIKAKYPDLDDTDDDFEDPFDTEGREFR